MIAALMFPPVQQPLVLSRDSTIVRSGRIAAKNYVVSSVRIGKDGITVDFASSTLRSAAKDQASFAGTGLLLENRRNVTIKNLDISGFQYNVRLLNCRNIKLINCTVDRSRAIRMATAEGRPVDTFVNIRDVNAWRTYGAGIWLENTSGSSVMNCRGAGAQNGLLMVDSSGNTVENCDFSFNSGWGIGLARSSRNDIIWNRADFVSRPWGGGWGGDASGFAVVDGSNENYFVGNSFTHGGDGFFLTDRVNGGFDPATKTFKFDGSSNNNVIAHNDGSWSPANAFEGTFSFGNVYFRNLANDSSYGFWLGYSSDSLIARNDIWRSRADAIGIEQGSNNVIELNDIQNTAGTAVHLWSGMAPEHKTRPSTNNRIVGNQIIWSANAYSLENSTNTLVLDNKIEQARIPADSVLVFGEHVGVSAFMESDRYRRVQRLLSRRPAGFLYYRETGMPQGLKWVEAGEFAPRDFRKDIIAWRRVNESELEIEGVQRKAYSLTHASEVEMVPAPGNRAAFFIRPVLAAGAVGGFIDPKIVATQGGRTQRISTPLFATDWLVRWYNWDKDRLKVDDVAAWDALFASPPVIERHQRQVAGDFSFKSQAPGIRTEYFAFEGVTRVNLDAGTYEFSALPDDGLQVFFDGQKVIDAWRMTPGDQSARVTATAGPHEIRVRFMQTWGHTYLRLAFARVL
jgi:parallel beta-helix repeat protein